LGIDTGALERRELRDAEAPALGHAAFPVPPRDPVDLLLHEISLLPAVVQLGAVQSTHATSLASAD
jgi:hypothetical protein